MDRPYVVSAVLGAVINFTVNYALIPFYGAVGAALATTLSEMVVCFVQVWAVKDKLPIKSYFAMVLPGILLGAFMCAALFFVPQIGSPFVTLAVKVCTGGVIFIGGLGILYLLNKNFKNNMDSVLNFKKILSMVKK